MKTKDFTWSGEKPANNKMSTIFIQEEYIGKIISWLIGASDIIVR